MVDKTSESCSIPIKSLKKIQAQMEYKNHFYVCIKANQYQIFPFVKPGIIGKSSEKYTGDFDDIEKTYFLDKKRRYCIQKKPKSGSQGTTFLCEDNKIKRQVIIKTASLKYSNQISAENMEKVQGKSVPTIYDYFEEGEHCFLVMQYGGPFSLYEYYKETNDFKELLYRTLEILEVFIRIHRKKYVHGDIKSQNITVTEEQPQAFVIDWNGLKQENQRREIYNNLLPQDRINKTTQTQDDLICLGKMLKIILKQSKTPTAIQKIITAIKNPNSTYYLKNIELPAQKIYDDIRAYLEKESISVYDPINKKFLRFFKKSKNYIKRSSKIIFPILLIYSCIFAIDCLYCHIKLQKEKDIHALEKIHQHSIRLQSYPLWGNYTYYLTTKAQFLQDIHPLQENLENLKQHMSENQIYFTMAKKEILTWLKTGKSNVSPSFLQQTLLQLLQSNIQISTNIHPKINQQPPQILIAIALITKTPRNWQQTWQKAKQQQKITHLSSYLQLCWQQQQNKADFITWIKKEFEQIRNLHIPKNKNIAQVLVYTSKVILIEQKIDQELIRILWNYTGSEVDKEIISIMTQLSQKKSIQFYKSTKKCIEVYKKRLANGQIHYKKQIRRMKKFLGE